MNKGIIPSNKVKDVKVFYFYRTEFNDDMDVEELISKAFSKIGDDEVFDIVKYTANMWFGVSSKSLCCIYIDFDDEDMNCLEAVKFVDNKVWKLNAGYMYIDNNYQKIIITSAKPANELYKDNNRWKEKIKTFISEKV